MFVKAGAKSHRGGRGTSGEDYPDIPLPGDSSEDGFLRRPDPDSGRERERLRAVTVPPENGCFCSITGCTGSACGQLNGCVCNSTGSCWGAACSARVPTMTVAPVMAGPTAPLTQPMAAMPAGQLIVQPTATPVISSTITSPGILTNSLQAVRSALLAPLQTLSVNGQQVQMQPGLVGNAVGAGCSCDQNGCVGNGCANLNGCFCVGQNCWGNACQTSIVSAQQQQQGGRLINGQSGNFIDIPGLFGGGNGGGMNFEGQTIPVVQGIPVTRLNGQRARRLRGNRGRGSMALSSGRVKSRVRPQTPIKKRMKEVEEVSQDQDEATNDRSIRTRTEEEYGVEFDNDFLPFKTEVTKESMPSLQDRFSPEEFDTETKDDGLTRHQRFAQKLQKSLAKFWKSSSSEESGESEPESERRSDMPSEPLVFAEDVLNVNILTLDDTDDFRNEPF